MRAWKRGTRRAALGLALALGIAAPRAAPAGDAPVPLDAARERLAGLEQLLSDPRSSNEDLVAAIASVERACASLAPEARPPGDAAPPPKEIEADLERFGRSAEAAFLRALVARQLPKKSRENLRHPVQVRAAQALGRADPRVLPALRHALLQDIKDRDYDPWPAFYEAAFDALVRLDAPRAVEWLLRECVNADGQPESRARLLAAIRAMRRARGLDGPHRYAIVDRLIQLFQAPDFWWADDYMEVAGFRDEKRRANIFQNGYWPMVRWEVMETLWRFSIDPRTGFSPVDYNDASDLERVGRYLVWFANNKQLNATPWLDPHSPADLRVRKRTDVVHVRPVITAIERKYGVPWEVWWETDRPGPDRSPVPETAAPSAEEALRTSLLAPLVGRGLGDPEEEIRAVAAVLLGRLHAPDAAVRLRNALDTEASETVREAAALGLLHLQDPAQRDLLRARVEDGQENPRVRAYSLLALGFLRDGAWIRGRILEKGAAPFPGPEPVVRDLQACALRALGIAKTPGDGPFLASLLSGDALPAAIRGHAGTALLRLRDPATAAEVLHVLWEKPKTPDLQGMQAVQAGAAIALPGVVLPGDAKSISQARRVLHEAEGRWAGARNLVAVGLARIGGPGVHELLVEEYGRCKGQPMRDAERGWFLLAFGLEGTPEARRLLEAEMEALDHERDRGACAAGLALARDVGAAPAIRWRIAESDWEYAAPAATALAALGDRGAVPVIREALSRRSEGPLLESGAEALGMLLGEKGAEDLLALWERCREAGDWDAVSRGLAAAASERTVAAMRAILDDTSRSPRERAFALATLGRMADPTSCPVRREFETDLDPYAEGPTLILLHRSADLPFLCADVR